jgi:ABC-type multidrug transport system ATPase subunit
LKLEIRHLKKRLGKRWILDGIELSMAPADALVVLGHNGSGKSTLLRLVAGITEPDEGQVLIDAAEVGASVIARRKLGYVPDNHDPLPELLVAELCALVGSLKQAPPPSPALIAELGVTPFFHQRLSTLSFGQRKRACLLAALIGAPQILILDEPTNGLDPEGVTLMLELVAKRQRAALATLIATNDRPFASAIAGREFELRDGRLTATSASSR